MVAVVVVVVVLATRLGVKGPLALHGGVVVSLMVLGVVDIDGVDVEALSLPDYGIALVGEAD